MHSLLRMVEGQFWSAMWFLECLMLASGKAYFNSQWWPTCKPDNPRFFNIQTPKSNHPPHMKTEFHPGPRHVAAEGMEVTSSGRCWPGSLYTVKRLYLPWREVFKRWVIYVILWVRGMQSVIKEMFEENWCHGSRCSKGFTAHMICFHPFCFGRIIWYIYIYISQQVFRCTNMTCLQAPGTSSQRSRPEMVWEASKIESSKAGENWESLYFPIAQWSQ